MDGSQTPRVSRRVWTRPAPWQASSSALQRVEPRPETPPGEGGGSERLREQEDPWKMV